MLQFNSFAVEKWHNMNNNIENDEKKDRKRASYGQISQFTTKETA
jgi:hypothetical protein